MTNRSGFPVPCQVIEEFVLHNGIYTCCRVFFAADFIGIHTGVIINPIMSLGIM